MQIESEIIEHIREHHLPSGGEDLSDTTPILELGILNSFSMMKLVEWIEQRYSVQLESKDVTVTNFHTVSSIVYLINRKREEQEAG